MARRLKWTEAALSDIEHVAEYIARDSRFYAAAFVREVQQATRSLASMPLRGRVVPELEDTSVREIFVKKYRLIYRVADDATYILGLIHGARDLDALWRRERRE